MNKSTLIETLRNETGLSKSKSEQVVDLFFDEISEALTNGDRVQIRGLFAFQVRKYKGTRGETPKPENRGWCHRRNYRFSSVGRN